MFQFSRIEEIVGPKSLPIFGNIFQVCVPPVGNIFIPTLHEQSYELKRKT